MSVKIAIAHHAYEATREDEISFAKDEVIEVTDDADSDWWSGKKKDGASGFFPSNFVTVRQDDPIEQEASQDIMEATEDHPIQASDAVNPSDDQQEAEAPEEKKVDQVIGMARVMEDYASQEAGEISISRGGIIHVYEILDNVWSRGELNGKVGKYPSKFVEDIDMPGRPDLGRQSSAVGSGEGSKPTLSSGEDAPKGGFKLAAYGVKQGGIGSLLAGGFPSLKKTGGGAPPKKTEDKRDIVVTEEPASSTSPITTTFVPPVPAFTASDDAPKVEEQPVGKAIVLHPYNAESEDELTLLRGEYVDVLDRNADEGWWNGKNERGESGIFPANFVKELQEDHVAPPTPTRSRRSVQAPRPASVQTASTVSPVTLNQRPCSVQASSMIHAATLPPSPPKPSTPPIPKKTPTSAPIMEEAEETKQAIQEEEQYDADEEKPTSPEVEESPVLTPLVAERQLPPRLPPAADKENEMIPSPVVVEENPISDPEEKESGVDETPFTKKENSTLQSKEDEDPMTTVPVSTESPVEAEQENNDSVMVKEEASKQDECKNVSHEATGMISDEAESETSPKGGEANQDETEKEKNEFDGIPPPSGPKLTAHIRARIVGRARKSPQATQDHEPSQMETLQKELAETQQQQQQQPEEEEKPVPEKPASPPAKPIKPIFAKFPTPFVGVNDEISKRNLKPTQTRPLWDKTPSGTTTAADVEEDPAPVLPSGVKNIASRFNFSGGGGSGSNEVLETKLRNHTKNEVDKVRKEFELLLQQEREQRTRLETTVAELMERVQSLEN